MNEKKDERHILERLNAAGIFSIISLFISVFPLYFWLEKSYSKALGFNNIIIKPQVSAVFFSILFYTGMIIYYILMVKCKPKKEIENGKMLCIIECVCFANFLVMVFILAVSRQAGMQLANNAFKIIIFVAEMCLNIGIYIVLKMYELVKKKNIFENGIKALIIIESINLVLLWLFFNSIAYATFITIVAAILLALFAITLCDFKESLELDDNTKICAKAKDKLEEYGVNISTILLVIVISFGTILILLNEFNDNFLGRGIAIAQYSFVKIESDDNINSADKTDGYLLFETDTGKYISIGYKLRENNHIKLNSNYKYINVEGKEVSEEFFMIDID